MTAERRPVTLITGASAGIGSALARIYAANGHEVMLVARRADRLAALADEIAGRGHRRPLVAAVDLQARDAVRQIDEQMASQGVEPEIVVNNAGFGLLGPAASLDRGEQLAMIDLNIRALTELSLAWIDVPQAPQGRHSQRRVGRRLPAGSRHGGLLRHQGLRAVVQPGAAS